MVIDEIRTDIEAIERNKALEQEISFNDRVEAIDYIDFNIIERVEAMLLTTDQHGELVLLKQRAEMVKGRLEQVNEDLLNKLRADIRNGTCTGARLKRQIEKYIGWKSRSGVQEDTGYDSVDVFINGLLRINGAPEAIKEREPEMAFYQPTPARIILELIEQANIAENDVFYDLGSGLGYVSILVNLFSGARAKGVEFEPAYYHYARRCATELGLSRVEFINADAREASYSDGTIFFMYTPFWGKLLQDVLEKIKIESSRRMIRVYTYGSCTLQVSQQSWLKPQKQNSEHVSRLGMFMSLDNATDSRLKTRPKQRTEKLLP